MPNPVIPSDLAARWRPLSVEEEEVAQALIDDAWAVLLARVPGIEARMSAGTLSDALVRKVESAMVLRVLRNPEGLRQFSIDDGSYTRDQALSSGLLYLADNEAAELTTVAGYTAGRGAYIISLGG